MGGDKLIAVSTSGFTDAARQMAASRRVELRTVEQLDPGDVLSWLGVNELVILRPGAEMAMEVEVYSDPSWEEPLELEGWVPPQDLILESTGGSRPVSAVEAWSRVTDEEFWEKVPRDGTRQPLHATFLMKGSDDVRLLAETPFGPALVRVLRFDGNVWFETDRVAAERATSYLGPRGVIARSAFFSFDEGGHRLTVTLHRVEVENEHPDTTDDP